MWYSIYVTSLLSSECFGAPKCVCCNLISNVRVSGDEVFEMWLGHKDKALVNSIVSFTGETLGPRVTPLCFHHMGTQCKEHDL
jgi:hypothetical protein